MKRTLSLVFAIAPLGAQTTVEQMQLQTVNVLTPTVARIVVKGDAYGTTGDWELVGAGFVIDDEGHVVTSYRVCEALDLPPIIEAISVAEPVIRLSADEADWIDAEAEILNERKNLCILHPQKPLDRPPVTLALEATVSDGQRVVAIGYTQAGSLDEKSQLTPNVTDGVISAKVLGDGKITDARLYQTDAAINPGGFGGPLFDECGRVVGMAASKAMGSDIDNVGWAVRADELAELLESESFDVETTTEPCEVAVTSSGGSTLKAFQIGSIILTLAAAGFAFTRRGRAVVSEVASRYTRRRTPPPIPGAGDKAVLKGLSGFYDGTTVELSGKRWALGRDPRVANLVFPPEAGAVSKRHCLLSYEDGTFTLEDGFSTNGTFLASGERLEPGAKRKLKRGDRFYLGDRENMFEVGLEPGG